MRYKQQYDGEWIQPRRKYYYMKCCDCGVVHKIEFRLVGIKNKKIQFRGFKIGKWGKGDKYKEKAEEKRICPKATQCANTPGGLKCPDNVTCPLM